MQFYSALAVSLLAIASAHATVPNPVRDVINTQVLDSLEFSIDAAGQPQFADGHGGASWTIATENDGSIQLRTFASQAVDTNGKPLQRVGIAYNKSTKAVVEAFSMRSQPSSAGTSYAAAYVDATGGRVASATTCEITPKATWRAQTSVCHTATNELCGAIFKQLTSKGFEPLQDLRLDVLTNACGQFEQLARGFNLDLLKEAESIAKKSMARVENKFYAVGVSNAISDDLAKERYKLLEHYYQTIDLCHRVYPKMFSKLPANVMIGDGIPANNTPQGKGATAR